MSKTPVAPSIFRLTAIFCLFASGCPAAIFWRIGTVIVDAVELMIWRGAASHIGEKSFVNVPTRIKFYASASVAIPILTFWIATALTRFVPAFPLRGRNIANPITMLGVGSLDTFDPQTSARLAGSALQVLSKNDTFVSAVTTTQKTAASIVDLDERKDNESAKTLTAEINDLVFSFGHMTFLTNGGSFVN